eukprot:TRINITY_DN232_c0_g1_i3.p1 TRINITY_DN232_c0_g1~~TRINITY_DN232_c0_g1_i3.p1  ORF type:complete len:961 (+),score=223.95 TRINITY_DN232_c0_g1_i3:2-2884(+)
MDDVPTIFGGWMVKKGQKRYFVLRDLVLYWFTSEQNHRADFKSSARGSTALTDCVCSVVSDRPRTFQLQTPSGDLYVLKCYSDNDLETWVKVLKGAVQRSDVKKTNRGRLYKAEYLVKKGLRRYFVLEDGFFSWYLNQGDTAKKGALDLKACTLSNVVNDDSFVISSSILSKEYRIQCPNGIHQARAWLKVLQEAINDAREKFDETLASAVKNVSGDIFKEGFLEKKGLKRFFKLINGVLAWYNANPRDRPGTRMNGSLNLTDCQISRLGFQLIVRPAAGKSYTLKAATKIEAEAWATVLLSTVKKLSMDETKKANSSALTITEGWVTKKYMGSRKEDRRYISLQSNKLFYYDREPSMGVHPKGEIFLGDCQVSLLGQKTFVISPGRGRDYPWQCQNQENAKAWVGSINYCIQQANKSLEMVCQKYQWLVGGRSSSGDRWVCVTLDKKLLWFDRVMHPNDISERQANGSLQISPNMKVGVNPAKKLSFAIQPPRGGTMIWTVPDETSRDSWVTALHALTKGTKSIKKKEVFGVRLEELVQKEERPCPKIIQDCCEFIAQHGTDQLGIFRVSGRASELESFIEQYNSGREVLFSPSNDVHAVAGILKQFFREMPEPVIPFNLYDAFLEANSPDKVRALLPQLPGPYLELTSYLFRFLSYLAKFSAVTKMESSNLAIVFAPNVLRTQDSTRALADFPASLAVVTLMINQADYIFQGVGSGSDSIAPHSAAPPANNQSGPHTPRGAGPPPGAPPPLEPRASPRGGPPPSRPPPSNRPPSGPPPTSTPPQLDSPRTASPPGSARSATSPRVGSPPTSAPPPLDSSRVASPPTSAPPVASPRVVSPRGPPPSTVELGSTPNDAPPPSYDAPPPSYDAPPPSYDAPPPSYDAPPPSYDAPPPSYDAPPPSYDAPPPSYDAPPPSYDAPPPDYDPDIPPPSYDPEEPAPPGYDPDEPPPPGYDPDEF